MVSMLPHRMSEYATKIEQLTAENKRLTEKLTMKTTSNISRNGIKWSDNEREQLILEAGEMKSIYEIAEIHQRSVSSIRYKFLHYGMELQSKNILIDDIVKVLPIKKKDLIEYIAKINDTKNDDGLSAQIPMKYVPYEKRGIILFDLNGTLCHRTSGPVKEIFIRPCVRELSKLKNYYKLGVFTSMMRSNAFDVLRLVEDKCGRIFDRSLIFTREHTVEFTAHERKTFNISPYKTKKSLAHVLPEIFQCGQTPQIKIVDDELVKIVEKDCAIVIPCWDGYSADSYIKDLVTELTIHITPY